MTSAERLPPNFLPGQRHTVTIGDIAFGGEGVGRVGEFVVFVPFVLLGERVEVELTEVKKRFARARLVRVLEAAPDRVSPVCRHFGECGGCQYQHVAYPAQLRLKAKQVRDIFERLGGIPASTVTEVAPCPSPYGYRNRIMIRSQWDKFKQGLNLGFLRHDNRLVVDVERCEIAEPELNDGIRQLRLRPPPKGGLKVVLRSLPEDWEVPPDSFFQNNFHLLPKLVEVVGEGLRDSGARFLVDAYCGVGFFALELAAVVEAFVGVETDQRALAAARRNAERQGRRNGEFIAGRTEEQLPGLLARFLPEKTAVLMDPPRVGCAKAVLEQLRQSAPTQVLYVSCHPATLARDLNALCRDGVYKVMRVVPLDLFPQTQHVECVADLRAGGGGASASAPALKACSSAGEPRHEIEAPSQRDEAAG